MKKNSMGTPIMAAGSLVAMGILLPTLASAAYLNAGRDVLLGGRDVMQGNVYVAGGSVNVTSPVGGDILAGGGTVIISGKVTDDIMAAGGTVIIVGASAQDVRVAGANVTIGSQTAGEIAAVGGTVTIAQDTTIAKDSYLGGGQIVFDGTEAGNLTIAGGNIRIDGTVGGNVIITKAKTVTIGSRAVIKKSFEYTAPTGATVEPGAQVLGQTVFHQAAVEQDGRAFFWGLAGIWFTLKFIALLAAALLIWYFRRRDAVAAIEASRTHFLHELLRGFLFLVAIPVAAVIATFTVIGTIPAVIAVLSYAAILTLTAPVSAIFVASLLKRDRESLAWYHLALGAFLWEFIGIIPFIGWAACLVVFLVTLGGVLHVLRLKFQDRG